MFDTFAFAATKELSLELATLWTFFFGEIAIRLRNCNFVRCCQHAPPGERWISNNNWRLVSGLLLFDAVRWNWNCFLSQLLQKRRTKQHKKKSGKKSNFHDEKERVWNWKMLRVIFCSIKLLKKTTPRGGSKSRRARTYVPLKSIYKQLARSQSEITFRDLTE